MKIRIDIEFMTFNNEWHAEVWLSHNINRYLGSDKLDTLMLMIESTVLEYYKEMTAK